MNKVRNQKLYIKEPNIKILLNNVKMRKKKLEINLNLKSLNNVKFSIEGLRLINRNDKNLSIDLPISLKDSLKKKDIRITSLINLVDLPLITFYWDFYISVKYKTETQNIRINCNHYVVLKKLRHQMSRYTVHDKLGYVIYPYVTVNGGLSLAYRKQGSYETKPYKIKEYMAYFYFHCIYRFFNDKRVWLIHEKFSETAQDNSFHFFKYCYNEHFSHKTFYIIKKGSKDENNLKRYKDRVVYFMSFKHLLLILSSELIISSEAKGHGYAWRVSRGVIKKTLTEKRFVFLQHGVLGLKKVDNTFNFNSQNSAELFVASSEFEREIIKNHLGYEDKHVMITGLARWDNLIDKSKQIGEKFEILMMPTWRNWLEEVEEVEFLNSNYYQMYNKLLQSKQLKEFLTKHNCILNFYVHPKFMPYVENFEQLTGFINVIQFGEENVNDLIMRAKLLITDYSSVSWEMYYQNKPVIFFQFDLEMYNNYQGSYMDLEKDLFGEVTYNIDDLIKAITQSALRGFKLEQKHTDQKVSYFKYIDKNNCSRIYDNIVKIEHDTEIKSKIKHLVKKSDIIRTMWRRYKHLSFIKHIIKKLKSRTD